MVCSFLEGLGLFQAAGGWLGFWPFSGFACGIAKSECFSHVHIGSWSLVYHFPGGVGFACVALAILAIGWLVEDPLRLRLRVCKNV